MVNGYNLYNLEASFKKFLVAENISPITLKNYLSDFRHFAGWLISINSRGLISVKINSLENIITLTAITNYKNYLIACKLPIKTINRRLSTLRKFCSFCISHGWLHENPAKKVGNVVRLRNPYCEEIRKDVNNNPNTILSTFQQYLIDEGVNRKQVINYLNDVQDFLRSSA